MSMTFRPARATAPAFGMDAEISVRGRLSELNFGQEWTDPTIEQWSFDAAVSHLAKLPVEEASVAA
jgi:hypothetical protein